MIETSPATFVLRKPPTVEAMLVTEESAGAAEAWIRSKGGGWHTYGKRWGNPGFGFARNQDDPASQRSIEYGQALVWNGGNFYAQDAKTFETYYAKLIR